MRITKAVTIGLIVAALSLAGYRQLAIRASKTSALAAVDSQPPWGKDLSDRNGDGIPDFLDLRDGDGDAFRAWFTFLAETTYYQSAQERPAEVNDCAALLRFAFREALKQHDGAWASVLKLPMPPALPAIRKYHYPSTPIAPNLFRIKDGEFLSANLTDGSFAQFADAETLRRYNTYFVSRDVRAARPGDLLFYRQDEQDMPDHAMIFVGKSHFDDSADPWIVYHTGPVGTEPGEIRRPTLKGLMNHREPRWHPVAANDSFLGVYRWNILQ
jgi:uncharacterized protein YfaT (DUF1175 family)